MRLGVLGPLTVDGEARDLPPRARTVLEALVVFAGESVHRERLADAVWPDPPPGSWSKQIDGRVAELRKVLGKATIETTPHGYRLVLPRDDVDAWRFERVVQRGRELLTFGQAERAAHVLGDGLALWRGPPLQDVEDWEPGRIEVERLGELRRDAEELRLEALLEAGRYGEVLATAQAATAEAPLRERRWTLLAQAQYQAGRQAEALRTLRRARAVLAEEGLEPDRDVTALEDAILRQDPALAPEAAAHRGPAATCPYLGLVPYDVDDADAFFGRDAAVATCRRRLADDGVLVVVGPSGNGKSSLVRAGIAAGLRRDGERVMIVTPGAHPMKSLSALPQSGPASVLVVDQCEEVVTLCEDPEERIRFLDALAVHADLGRLVVTLRADRLGELSAHTAFARLVERGLHLLGPLGDADLRTAIEGPAHQAGLLLEPGLVELLVTEVEGEAGALPLLSHVLRATWERREGRTLTVAGYRDSGGIHGAVARSAEKLYHRILPDQQPLVRDILLRLAPRVDGERVPRRVPRRLVVPDADHERIVEMLVTARLLTSGEDVVELAHEALAHAWPRLRAWLDEDIEGVRILRHLSLAADTWDALGRPDSELYRGIRLEQALDWRERTDPDITPTERAFLEASRALARTEQETAEERARHQAGLNRRLKRGITLIGALAAIAIVATAVAVLSVRRADHEAAAAEARAREADLHRLVSASQAQRATRRDLALLLAVEAERRDPGVATQSALFGALQPTPSLLGYLRPPGDRRAFTAMLVTAQDEVIVGDSRGRVLRFDLETRERLGPPLQIGPRGRAVTALAADPSGDRLAAAFEETRSVWLVETAELGAASASASTGGGGGGGSPGRTTPVPDEPRHLAISEDGAVAVGTRTGTVTVVDHATGRQRASIPAAAAGPDGGGGGQDATLVTVAFAPDGRLAVGSAGGIDLRAAGTFAPAGSLRRSGVAADGALRFSSDGAVLVSAARQQTAAGQEVLGSLMAWDMRRLAGAWPSPRDAPCTDVAVAVGRVVCSSGATGLHLSLTSGEEITETEDLAFRSGIHFAPSPDGDTLVAAVRDDVAAEVFSLDGRSPVMRLVGSPESYPMNYSPDDPRIMLESATASSGTAPVGPRELWDSASGRHVTTLDVAAGVLAPGGRVAAVFNDGSTGLLDLATGRRTPVAALTSFKISGIAFDQYRDRVAVSSDDGWVEQRSLVSGEAVGARHRFDDSVDSVAYIHHGRVLAVAHGQQVSFIDADEGHEAMPRVDGASVAASIDGSVLATAALKGDVTLREPATGKAIGDPLIAGNAKNNYLTISDDGRRLLVTNWDGTARLFDVASRAQIGEAMRIAIRPVTVTHIGGVLRPDGLQMALATTQGVELWDLDVARWREAACDVAGRNLTRDEWEQYLPPGQPYRRTCPQWPADPAGSP